MESKLEQACDRHPLAAFAAAFFVLFLVGGLLAVGLKLVGNLSVFSDPTPAVQPDFGPEPADDLFCDPAVPLPPQEESEPPEYYFLYEVAVVAVMDQDGNREYWVCPTTEGSFALNYFQLDPCAEPIQLSYDDLWDATAALVDHVNLQTECLNQSE